MVERFIQVVYLVKVRKKMGILNKKKFNGERETTSEIDQKLLFFLSVGEKILEFALQNTFMLQLLVLTVS